MQSRNMIKPMANDDSRSDNKNGLVIKPTELKKKMDNGDDIFILDVRSKQEHDLWTISYDNYPDSLVIPVDTLSSLESLKHIPKDKEIITFCSHGQRSSMAARTLASLGYNVRTVESGMAGWSRLYDVAEISFDSGITLKIWQIRRISKGCMSYVIASTKDKKATIIDATCDIDTVINKLLQENELTISRVLDTHIHADHLSGSIRVAKKYGSEVLISSLENYSTQQVSSEKEPKYKPISTGQKFELGDGFYLEAIHTPGHTDGSMSFLLSTHKVTNNEDINKQKISTDSFAKHNDNNDNPGYYLFTGDTIFVNGVGRPDLHNKSQEYTNKLYHTYQNVIFNLPDKTIILPAHYSSSFEHKKPVLDSLGSIKQKLASIIDSENKFLDFVSSNMPPHPMNYEKIVYLNKKLITCNMVNQVDLESGPNSCGIKA
jgi:glyoxylase-like metal-dependent hydrolase (beta-lactamase superfamily II)/rhodanese-related sulfurtransferase